MAVLKTSPLCSFGDEVQSQKTVWGFSLLPLTLALGHCDSTLYAYLSGARGGCWKGEQRRFSLANSIIWEDPCQADVLVWSTDDQEFITLE